VAAEPRVAKPNATTEAKTLGCQGARDGRREQEPLKTLLSPFKKEELLVRCKDPRGQSLCLIIIFVLCEVHIYYIR